jgi:hypothetical protein
MTIIAVVFSYLKMLKQCQDQYRFYCVFYQWMKENPSFLKIFLLLFDCIVNIILPFFTVLLTFFLISSSDEVNDLVLNCLAITFIVELDDDLNHRDPVEVNDLVIQSFKKYLFLGMKRITEEIQNGITERNTNFGAISMLATFFFYVFFESTRNNKTVFDSEYLLKQLKSADYFSDLRSLNENLKILMIVQSFIMEGVKLLPVENGTFHGDPDFGKLKHLVMRFKNGVIINVRENLDVDFAIVEKMLRNYDFYQHINTDLAFDSYLPSNFCWYYFVCASLSIFCGATMIFLYVSFKIRIFVYLKFGCIRASPLFSLMRSGKLSFLVPWSL